MDEIVLLLSTDILKIVVDYNISSEIVFGKGYSALQFQDLCRSELHIRQEHSLNLLRYLLPSLSISQLQQIVKDNGYPFTGMYYYDHLYPEQIVDECEIFINQAPL